MAEMKDNPFNDDKGKNYANLLYIASGEVWGIWKKHADSRGMGGVGNKAGDDFWDSCINDFDGVMRKYKDTPAGEYVRKLGMVYLNEIEKVCIGAREI